MRINYNQLDETKKVFQFTDGCYPVEFTPRKKWVWTSGKFSGVVNNVGYAILTLESDIDNTLYYEDNEMVIKPDCINIVKLNLESKSEFELNLEKEYDVPNDNRKLGLKIISVNVDGDVIF